MDYYEINDKTKVHPGEYLLYTPKMEIVLCGAYMPAKNMIKALSHGTLIEDKIQNFRKIRLNKKEREQRAATRCKGCTGK